MVKYRLLSIDCLRGFAALWVLLYHIWNRYFPDLTTQGRPWSVPESHSIWYDLTFPTIQFGYVGVTLFFILSGFCIHLPQAREFLETGSNHLDLAAFSRRRFFRLYPAYFVSIIVTSLALGIFPLAIGIYKRQIPDLMDAFELRDAALSAFFLQLFRPSSLGFNGVYWTLIFEVQFYLVYPTLLLLCRRVPFAAVGIILFGIELYSVTYPSAIEQLFVARWYEWFLGMWAAELYVTRRTSVLQSFAILGLPLGICATLWTGTWPYRDLLLATGFFGLTLAIFRAESSLEPDRTEKFNHRFRFLIWMGTISYSLYLMHLPIIDAFWRIGALMSLAVAPSVPFDALIIPLSIPTALLAGSLAYRWIEVPFMLSGKPRPVRNPPREHAQTATPA